MLVSPRLAIKKKRLAKHTVNRNCRAKQRIATIRLTGVTMINGFTPELNEKALKFLMYASNPGIDAGRVETGSGSIEVTIINGIVQLRIHEKDTNERSSIRMNLDNFVRLTSVLRRATELINPISVPSEGR